MVRSTMLSINLLCKFKKKKKGKAEEPENKLPTWQRKQENSRKNTYFCFTDYARAFDCVAHNKL